MYALCVSGKGLIPNPEEEEYIRELNRALLDAVPESEDRNVTDPNPIIRKFLYVRILTRSLRGVSLLGGGWKRSHVRYIFSVKNEKQNVTCSETIG